MVRAATLVLVTLAAVTGPARTCPAQWPEKQFATPGHKRPDGLFAPGVAVGKTLYVAGKGDYKPDLDTDGKVKNCLAEVRKTLALGGMDFSNVVSTFVYLEDPGQYAAMNKAYAEFFPDSPPSRTTLGVSQVPGDSRLEITCVAYADPAEVKRVGEPPAGFPFSPGVLAGGTLYVSGKGDQLPGGGHPEGFEAQARQCLKNVEATLGAAGLGFGDVVMTNVFLDRAGDVETVDRVYREFVRAGDEPACSLAFVDWIPGGSHLEVTCVATTDRAGRKAVRPGGLTLGPADGSVTGSPAVWSGPTLYVSGLAGTTPGGGLVAGAVGEQVRGMARNHVAVLDEAGLKLDDIVSGFVYLRDMADYAPMNAVYKEYYSKGPAVRTCLMPEGGTTHPETRVRASFIAARTK